ncbi:FAD-dependent oxidoreductase [Streptomyces sp. JH34]|uniref:FAD-dependent oxidoreductase n=1 Tax=Streptomyces sp. JH34 TaxID=2793633 RepID=UPI0023F93C4A|nr:FAD-dependent oxidoreductase [Streptomyces sp. JH34]MDF6017362.1 FAD-dependent monooxygenase [Streptomyces sp. JH34]
MTTADNAGGAPPNPPQVLVTGAGPVGLTAAVELARRGLRVRLIDAAHGPAVTSRAMATHARSLETYDHQGLVEDMLPRGRRIQRFTMHANGRRLARLGPDYSRVPTRYPMTLMIDQAATEDVLRQAAAKLGVKVEWGVRLGSFTQDAEAVHVVLHTADGEERLTVERLVGCDGGHSTVRKLLGLPLLGDSSETWLIADAELEAGLPQNSIHWIKVGKGTVMAIPFPEKDKWRLLDTADASYSGDPDEVADRFARKLRAGLGRPVRVSTPSWVSVFTIQQRMIARMREGRVMLAGDAAHVHSPASGQGLNTGVQDAYNLAWKLALVVRGHAPDTLLDSYSDERVPIGRALLGSTRKATWLVQLKNSAAGIALPVVFALVRRCGPLRGRIERGIIGTMSALALDYTDSPLTVPDTRPRTAAGPRSGTRIAQVTARDALGTGWSALLAELRDTRCTLLVAGGGAISARAAEQAHEAHADWLSVRVFADTLETSGTDETSGPRPMPDPDGGVRRHLGCAPDGWLLVRPDGYLCARGSALTSQELTPALDAVRGLRPARPGV